MQLKAFIDFDKMQKIEKLPIGTKLIALEDRRKRF